MMMMMTMMMMMERRSGCNNELRRYYGTYWFAESAAGGRARDETQTGVRELRNLSYRRAVLSLMDGAVKHWRAAVGIPDVMIAAGCRRTGSRRVLPGVRSSRPATAATAAAAAAGRI